MGSAIETLIYGALALFFLNAIHPFDFSVNDAVHEGKTKPLPYRCNIQGFGTVSGAMKDDIGVAIIDVQETKVISHPRYNDEFAQGKYIVVTFAICNQQKSKISVKEDFFTLVDRSGRKYEYDHAANWSVELEYKPEINPGLTVAKRIAYDVPANINLNDLQFKITMGLFGANMTLPLKVQFVQ